MEHTFGKIFEKNVDYAIVHASRYAKLGKNHKISSLFILMLEYFPNIPLLYDVRRNNKKAFVLRCREKWVDIRI